MQPLTSPSQPRHRGHSRLGYFILVILTLIVIAAVGFLITWLVTKPKKLRYNVENASAQMFTLSNDNHMSATFKITIQSHNPNHRTSVYYDSIELLVKFKGQTLAFDTVEPFHQPRMSVMRIINDTLVVRNVVVLGANGKDLRRQNYMGKIEFEVYVKARVRFKLGMWKSAYRTAKIDCSHVVVYLSEYSNKSTASSSCVANI